MAAWLALLFAALSGLSLTEAALTGSPRALLVGLADALFALACFVVGALR